MSTSITATELRRNVYRILDEVLESGQPREVIRRGRRLVIVAADAPKLRLDELPRRRARNCSFDDLVETSWEESWRPDS